MKPLILIPVTAGLLFISVLACSKKNSEKEQEPETVEIKTPALAADSVGNVSLSTATFYAKISSDGGGSITDRGIYWGKTANPTENKTTATSYKTNGEFTADLKGLDPTTTYFVRGYATNSKGTTYTADLQFMTAGVPAPTLFTDTMYASGAYTIFVAGRVTDAKGLTFKETGICLSKNANPTLADTKIAAATANEQNLFLRINNLEPATQYNIRAYATDAYGTTTYGPNVKVATIQKGNVTYSLAQNTNPTDDEKAAYARIKAAFDEAVTYYNNYTSITKTLYVTYNTGVATADATIAGNIRMGPNAAYQRTGTALHEMAHSVGVGQHTFWTSNLIIGGVYQGIYANQMLRFMTRSVTASLSGDSQHFWPYGINGASEDTGDEMLYLTNTMIIQGMKKDGLPSSY